MRRSFWRGVIATAICLGFLTFVASPAPAQTERVYTGVTPPAITPPSITPTAITPPAVGAVLSTSGERTPTAQVLPLQVSGGGVAAARQAPVRGLAFTGADIASMVVLALGAIALGAVLTRRGRPRSTTSN